MATSNYQMIWDPTNKKWTVAINGAAAVDLEQNVLLVDGLIGTPAVRFANDLDTGLRRIAADHIGLVAGGGRGLELAKSGTQNDVYHYSPAGNAYLLTTVIDASYTYIRNTGGILYIRTGANYDLHLGTNSTDRWIIETGGHLRPNANNNYDVGHDSYNVRHLKMNGHMYRGSVDRNEIIDSYHVFAAYRASFTTTAATWKAVGGTYTEYVDRGANFNASTGVFTAPVAGQYIITFDCYNSLAGGDLFPRISVNSGSYYRYGVQSAIYGVCKLAAVIDLAASDTVQAQLYHAATGSVGALYFAAKLIGED